MTTNSTISLSSLFSRLARNLEELSPTILEKFHLPRKVSIKEDGSDVTETDKWVEAQLKGLLSSLLPEAIFLGEETSSLYRHKEASVFTAPYVWIVDPIDGTHNFYRGFEQFGISIGLMKGGVGTEGPALIPLAGALLYPALYQLYFSSEEGVFGKNLVTGIEKQIPVQYDQGPGSEGLVCTGGTWRKYKRRQPPSHFGVHGFCAASYDALCTVLGRSIATVLFQESTAIWDIAGVLPLATKNQFSLFEFPTGKEIQGLPLSLFTFSESSKPWMVDRSLILSRREHLETVRTELIPLPKEAL